MDKKYKVAIIDDVKDLCQLIKLNLELTDEFNAIIIEDVNTVEEVCDNEKPDVVMVDFSMPLRDGPSIIDSLKTRDSTKNIPIILMSGWGDRDCSKLKGESPDGSSAKIKEEYIAEYLEKPFQADVLVSVVKKSLNIL